MGMFDSVFIKCPECGDTSEIQSKAGACMLHEYNLSNAPMSILGDIDGEGLKCQCGYVIKVVAMANVVHNTTAPSREI